MIYYNKISLNCLNSDVSFASGALTIISQHFATEGVTVDALKFDVKSQKLNNSHNWAVSSSLKLHSKHWQSNSTSTFDWQQSKYIKENKLVKKK